MVNAACSGCFERTLGLVLGLLEIWNSIWQHSQIHHIETILKKVYRGNGFVKFVLCFCWQNTAAI